MAHAQSAPGAASIRISHGQLMAIPPHNVSDVVVDDTLETLTTFDGQVYQANHLADKDKRLDWPGLYTSPDKPAQFPGGEDAFNKYLSLKVHIAREVTENGIVGTVFVRFVVTTVGKICCVQITSSSLPMATDVRAVIHAMPNWIPGMQSGQSVATEVNRPIHLCPAEL